MHLNISHYMYIFLTFESKICKKYVSYSFKRFVTFQYPVLNKLIFQHLSNMTDNPVSTHAVNIIQYIRHFTVF